MLTRGCSDELLRSSTVRGLASSATITGLLTRGCFPRNKRFLASASRRRSKGLTSSFISSQATALGGGYSATRAVFRLPRRRVTKYSAFASTLGSTGPSGCNRANRRPLLNAWRRGEKEIPPAAEADFSRRPE